jgi:hypothetical protein
VVLSKRERYIAIATICTLGLLIFYFVLIDPEIDTKTALGTKIDEAQLIWDNGTNAETRARNFGKDWNARIAGPLKSNSSDAASQLLPAVDKWAKEAGMSNLSINQPDRSDKEKDFAKFTLRATAKCNMKQLGAFMYRIQIATIPVRITDLTVSTPKEGTDELIVQMGISTIFLSPEPDAKPGPSASAKEGTP